MSLIPLASTPFFNNSKLFFSRKELNKIFSCYSIGVSRGNWKDYSIYSNKNETSFVIYKHAGSAPDCILTKYKKLKKNKIFFKLKVGINSKKNSDKIENLIAFLKRKHIKII